MTEPATNASAENVSTRDVDPELPRTSYLGAEHVLDEMSADGRHRTARTSALHVIVLAMMAGAFVTAGALFSVVVATGVDASGPKMLLAGFAFSAGFFFVLLSRTVLFTEANVVLPAVLLDHPPREIVRRVGRFWALAWVGNLAGAVLIGALVVASQPLSDGFRDELAAFIAKKTMYAEIGTLEAWFAAVLSGVFANWLVGMAAFFAVMGRTIVGMYVPVLLAVSLFVAANFQHSPANMGYFALATPLQIGPGWPTALWWNIVPAGIGNMIGGAALVAVPFWYVLRPDASKRPREEDSCTDSRR
ncbi:MAG: formate/nitrite transporter family protein [Trueperaceae bacterium]